MIDRQKVVQWLYDVVNGNCRKDDSEMAKQAIDLILSPPADLTPWVKAVEYPYHEEDGSIKDWAERKIELACALRDASKEA